MKGYHGRFLEVDLSSQTTKDFPLSEDFCKKYIGGATMAAALIFDRINPDTESKITCIFTRLIFSNMKTPPRRSLRERLKDPPQLSKTTTHDRSRKPYQTVWIQNRRG